MDINITIKCPDLALAAAALAKGLLGVVSPTDHLHGLKLEKLDGDQLSRDVTAAADYAASIVPPAPSTSTAPATAAPVAPVAPVTAAPQITIDQIGLAGANLLRDKPGAMPQLMGLLQKYGVQSAQQLKPEQIGAFATELRGLGAKI